MSAETIQDAVWLLVVLRPPTNRILLDVGVEAFHRRLDEGGRKERRSHDAAHAAMLEKIAREDGP
jgi:hypothetical protein